MAVPALHPTLEVGTSIRVIEGNVLGGYKRGASGRVAAVLRNTFTGEILYSCDMDGPGRRVSLILLPSEIEVWQEAVSLAATPPVGEPIRGPLSP